MKQLSKYWQAIAASNYARYFHAENVGVAHLAHVVRYSWLGCIISTVNATIFFIGAYGRVDVFLLAAWFAFAVLQAGYVWTRTARARGRSLPKRVSKRALRRLIVFACITSAPWAALPLLFYGTDHGVVDSLTLTICAGMIAGGAFMMHRVPAVAFVYSGQIAICVVVACVLRDFADYWPIALVSVPYAVYLAFATVGLYQVSEEREQSLAQTRDALAQLRRANAELDRLRTAAERAAVIDELTQLLNRRGLSREIERRGAEIESAGSGIAIFHLDLDRFKEINDTLGHAAGDAVLEHVANVLRSSTRAADCVARIGGDEFVILTDFDGDEAPLKCLAERLINEMRKPFPFEGEVCHFGASIGICAVSKPEELEGLDIERLLGNADIALYAAKEAGRGQFKFYTAAIYERTQLQRELADDLIGAIERGEFAPIYQPQFLADTMELCGVEALARWRHPTRGEVTPDIFVPIADRLGVTAEIDRALLGQAVQDLRMWDSRGLRIPRLSVNVSMDRLRDTELRRSLSGLDVEKGRLAFEIQETVFSDEIDDELQHVVDWLNESGVEIELDDFGSGHASLISLLNLQPRRLKLARALLSPVMPSERLRRLVELVVDTACALDIEPTAQGLETEEQALLAKQLGCRRLQGFYFARPMRAEALLSRYGPGGASALTARSA